MGSYDYNTAMREFEEYPSLPSTSMVTRIRPCTERVPPPPTPPLSRRRLVSLRTKYGNETVKPPRKSIERVRLSVKKTLMVCMSMFISVVFGLYAHDLLCFIETVLKPWGFARTFTLDPLIAVQSGYNSIPGTYLVLNIS